MKKETLLTIAVLGLLVLNIVLVIIFYTNQGRRPFMPPPPRGNEPNPDKFIINRLKFDQSQQKEFEKLKAEHQQKIMALNEESRLLHDSLFAQLKEPGQNPEKVSAIISSIGDNKEKIDRATFEHFAAIKALCKTNEQRELFNEFIGELGKMIGPPTPPGMNHPPHEQRPPPP
jgi:protein CpxP